MNLDAERQRLLGLAMAAPPGPYSKHGPWISAPESEDHRAGNIALVHGNKHWRPKTAAFIAAAHDMAALIREQAAEINRLNGEIAFNGPEPVIHEWPSCGCNVLPPKMCDDAYSYIGQLDMQGDVINRQAAELERLRADAERYRLVRQECWVIVPDNEFNLAAEALDEWADAAIAAERKGAGK